MRKLKNSKGFTLVEMLIVVAIIAILLAIAIPSFNNSLEKAREAADIANIRNAYSEAMVDYLSEGKDSTGTGTAQTPAMTQTKSGWQTITWPKYLGGALSVQKGNIVTVTVTTDDAGEVKVTCTVNQ